MSAWLTKPSAVETMIITNNQRQFLLFLASDVIPLIKYDKDARNACRDIYSKHARDGHAINGIRCAITDLCGVCDFPDETIKPFVKAVVAHFQGGKHTRRRLTTEEKDKLLVACGMKCEKCGKLLTDVNFDHIIPFCLVFDTIEDNRQCLCPECNKAKATTISCASRVGA